MIDKLSALISSEFVKHKIISEDAKDVYKYGIEITISSIIGFTITLIIGLLFHAVMQTIIYYVVFIALRSMTGGYHASSYLKCNTVFGLITSFVMIFSKSAAEIQLTVSSITLLFLPSAVIFLWLAPVENINKPIEKKRQMYLKITSVITSVLLYLLSLLLYINQHSFESAVIIITVFVVSILCLVEIFGKEDKKE